MVSEHEAKMAKSKRPSGTSVKGERAIEVELFTMFDVDDSGALSRKQLRQLLGHVRAKMGKGDKNTVSMQVPGMEEMLSVLDSGGDGQVSLEECERTSTAFYSDPGSETWSAVLSMAFRDRQGWPTCRRCSRTASG